MKKQLYILAIGFIALASSSCNDFLDREPLDSVPTSQYLFNENDLSAYTANMYGIFPVHAGYGLGTFNDDNDSDNQAGSSPNDLFVKGQTRMAQNGGDWDFGNIRTANYFINTVRPRLENGEIENSANNNHYLGEMYFFRAYIYAEKLISLGDFPIIKEMIADNYDAVREASKRRPRNEVARFIISDLDSAYHYMSATPPMTNRLTKDCAALLKSRIALFEGTWEKYHKGTNRVPGGPGWPGADKDYLKDFTINIEEEINYFLTQAKEAAQIVADNHALDASYSKLFNSQSLSSSTEALLWKQYDGTMTPAVNHFVVGYIQRNGGGNSGFTRSMVESFLMQDGTPIYASSDYQGDKTYENVAHGRDPRLLDNVLIPGDLLTTSATMTEAKIDKAGYYYRAPITEISENRCPTGYSIKKGLTTDPEQGPTLPATTASVVFRAAEAYLNYMEADCELNNGNLDANSMKYWEALRTRGGIAPNTIQHTIDLTDVTKENDLARYSGENLVSSTLYNIRRERRIELAAEGLRFEDLKRWRSLDMMQNYHVQGFNLWDENYKRYATPDAGLNGSNFDAPLNVIALKESGAEDSNVSAKADGVYMMPYRVLTNNIAFNGYNWNPNKYLNPIAFDHFRLTTAEEGSSDYTTSAIYQNPGWKIETNSLPEGD